MNDPDPKVTRLITALGESDPQASAALLPLLYDELRALARARMSKLAPGHTLQPTALVHEAYLRLAKGKGSEWNGRGHFFAAAAEAMRQVLVDQARSKSRQKRAGDRDRVDLDEQALSVEPPIQGVLELDELLADVESSDPRRARILKLRYFAGMSVDETAAALGLSEATVRRECRYARALLAERLEEPGPGS